MNNTDPLEEYQGRPRNVVFYGESGAGKSSLINLIMGNEVAETSPDALACTTTHTPYEVTINGQCFRLWDTAGLNEGSEGRVPAPVAKKNLNKFFRALKQEDGVHLLVYCVRGERASVALRNYKAFSSAICRSDVPIVLVVTCLEHLQPGMSAWWDNNKDKLAQTEIPFSGHACVTTLNDDPTDSHRIRERRSQSYQDVRKVILDKCSQTPHKTWGTATKYEGGFVEILMQKLARLIGLMQT